MAGIKRMKFQRRKANSRDMPLLRHAFLLLFVACTIQGELIRVERHAGSLIFKREATEEDSEPGVNPSGDPTASSLHDSLSTSSNEKKPPAAIIQSIHSASNITLRYAKTRIESKILNPAEVAQEVFFDVIIPETSFISGFSMEIDGTVYNAYVKEKEEAQKVYNTAVKQGVTAGHVKQSVRDSNRFSVSVNVEPQKKVRFNLTYEELLQRKYGLYRHVVNLNPGQVVEDLYVEVYIQENKNVTNVKVPEFQSGNDAYWVLESEDFKLAVIERISPTEVKVSFRPTVEDQKKLRIKTNGTEDANLSEGISGQFAVEYDVARDPDGGEILVNDGYFVHFFAPPNLPSLRKHIIFVLDVSGSMNGRKIEQLKQAMTSILDELKPTDYFNIIEFAFTAIVRDFDSPVQFPLSSPWIEDPTTDNGRLVMKIKPFPATPEYIKKGKDVVRRMNTGGGTNIHDALSIAIQLAQVEIKERIAKRSTRNDRRFKIPEPMIIFLTDGEATTGITSESKIIKSVDEQNVEPRIPIFCLAFGTDADFKLLKKISLISNGFTRQIYEAADTALQLRNFYREISSPVLSKVKFVYPHEQVQDETVTKVKFANFFGGSEIIVAGKVKNQWGNETIGVVEAVSAKGIRNYSVNHIDFSPPALMAETSYRPLERLWVYMTIKHLLNEGELIKARSYLFNYKDEPKPFELSPEEKALRLALMYSFVCPLTSLVVVKPGSLADANIEPAVARSGSSTGFKSSGVANALPLSFNLPPTTDSYTSLVGTVGGVYTMFAQEKCSAGPTDSSPSALDQITWLAQELTKDGLNIPGQNNSIYYQVGRNQPNEPYGQCTAGTISGVCRHLEHCVIPDIVNNFEAYYQDYFCVVPGNYAGICCPENPNIEGTTQEAETEAMASP